MIGALPWSAWLLLLAAIGIGLVVELVFFFRHRRVQRGMSIRSRTPDR